MPRYHFHIKDGVMLVHDREGMILEDATAARNHARDYASMVRVELQGKNRLISAMYVEITDEAGGVIDREPLDRAHFFGIKGGRAGKVRNCFVP